MKLVFGSLCAVKRSMIFYDLTTDNRWLPGCRLLVSWELGSREFSSKSAKRFCGSESDPLKNTAVIGNENDQVPKGRSVDALAHTGDEGRDTLR